MNFYGFKPPVLSQNMVFKVKGDLEQVRLFDYAARGVLQGAVQSTFRDGVRHNWAEFLSALNKVFASFLTLLGRYKLLQPLVWLLMFPFGWITLLNQRARLADYTKRQFVADAQGNYTYMSRFVTSEHSVRSCMAQLKLVVVEELFPEGYGRFPRREKVGESYATSSFTTPTGQEVVLDIWG